MKKFFLFTNFLFVFVSRLFSQEASVSFSPEGFIKRIKQIQVRFSQPMVYFGDPKANVNIFRVVCPAQGKGRWLDDKNYVYEFEKELEAGISCTFELLDTVVTLNNKKVLGKKKFEINTGGPQITSISPYEGSSIAEDQIFALYTDGEIDESSISDSVHLNVDVIKNKVPIVLLSHSNSDVKKIIEAKFKNNTKNLYFFKSKLNLPPSKQVEFVWGNVRSKSGLANTEKQVFTFQVQEPLSVSYFCTRTNEKAGCVPFEDISLSFSAPIPISEISKITMIGANKEYKATVSEGDSSKENSVYYAYIKGPFPEKTRFTINIPKSFQDDAGRTLSDKQRTLSVTTGEFPPLAKFSSRFGIIEAENPILPVTLRNLEPNLVSRIISLYPESSASLKNTQGKIKKISSSEIWYWMRRVYSTNRENSVFPSPNIADSFQIPRNHGNKAFEVVGIPLKTKGFYVIEIQSNALGNALIGPKSNMFVPTAALVTNMAVHFKQGRENSLVWVTQLNNAQPVSGAKIFIQDCKGNELFNGVTNNIGIVYVPKNLKSEYCGWGEFQSGLLVVAAKGDDFSFVHSNWTQGIENWRFNLPYGENNYTPYVVHTILDRTLFRAGETISMKHVMRKHGIKGFQFPKKEELPLKAKIVHFGTGNSYEVSIQWKNNFTGESAWKIPKEAKLGSYTITMDNKTGQYDSFYTASFQVEEFRIPILKASLSPPKEKLVKPKNFNVFASAKFFAGGAATALPIKFKYWFEDVNYDYNPQYPEYSFFTETLQEGRFNTESYYDDFSYSEEWDFSNQVQMERKSIQTLETQLDLNGTAQISIEKIPESSKNQKAYFEMEYKDPNGEYQTILSSTLIYNSPYKLGLKEDGWIANKKETKMTAIVLDLNNSPISGVNVSIDVYSKKFYSNRKRLVGGFYSYENYYEVKRLGSFCSGKTDSLGLLVCKKAAPSEGNLIFQASISGEKTSVTKEIYVTGDTDFGYYKIEDSDRMDVLAEQKFYEPNQTARLQVRMPFKEATALVTVEREGILEASLKTITSSNPILELKIKPNFAPNVFVSVLAVRGRVAEPKPTATVDLARPSHKLGITNIRVGWKGHELLVNVVPERKVYNVRDKAKVKIKITRADGGELPKDTEFAFAAVDEALLDLKSNTTWDLLNAMMKSRSLEVSTSTAQMQVVGRRHFGLKALPSGGGGGFAKQTRELFDTLLFWKASIPVNEKGEAEVTVRLNDSLTSFRLVGIANSGSNYFGYGYGSIQVTQDLMLFSGIPPVAREGDEVVAELTLRNTTQKPLQVMVDGKVSSSRESFSPMQVNLGKEESQVVSWRLKVPYGVDKLEYQFTVNSDSFSDKLKITQKIIPSIPVTVRQATLLQIKEPYQMEVAIPEGNIENRGGISLIYSDSLVSSLSSVKEYMTLYPFTCLEQQVSKAIALKDTKKWEQITRKLSVYLDKDGFAKYFPDSLYGDPNLTAYILSVVHERGWNLPDEERSFMLGALLGFVEGRINRHGVLQTADLSIRKLMALEALSRYGMAKKEHLEPMNLAPNTLPTSALLDYLNILYRVDINNKEKIRQSIQQILRTRMNLQGTFLKFSSEREDKLWWLMVSPDFNSVKLITTLLEQKLWNNDLGKIVRGTVMRQKMGHWDLTLANAWGSIALEKFANQFEKFKVNGQTLAQLSNEQISHSWTSKPKGGEYLLPWKEEKSSLNIQHNGSGNPWVIVQSKAAVPVREGIYNGYKIEKKFIDVERKNQSYYSIGDIIRVQLKVQADTDMTWVVISDPVPTGASILSGGLRASKSATDGEVGSYFYYSFEERAFDAYRVYYEYLPKGNWTIEYTFRINSEGNFILPQTRIEAMYSPDLYGEYPNPKFEIIR